MNNDEANIREIAGAFAALLRVQPPRKGPTYIEHNPHLHNSEPVADYLSRYAEYGVGVACALKALDIAHQSGGVDGAHHKAWVIDQMVRAILSAPMEERVAKDANGKLYSYRAQGESDRYRAWVAAQKAGEEGPNTYDWDEGIPP